MSIRQLIASRIWHAILVLILVSIVIFLAVEVLPGDVARRMLGREAPEESIELLRQTLGLNDPLIVRYGRWLWSVVSLDFGTSMATHKPVWSIILPRLNNTLLLSGVAFLAYFPLVVVLAMIQAVNHDELADHSITVVTILVLSMPEFLLATVMLLTFGLKFGWLPVSSVLKPSMSSMDVFRAIILPAVTLTLIMAVYAVRMLRDNLIDVLSADFVTMARFKGLSRWRILFRHVLPNAIAPTLNITALNLSYLIGGVVIVERVFAFPGFGSLMIDSLQLRDTPLIEACVMIAAFTYIAGNLLADIVTVALNPKLRA